LRAGRKIQLCSIRLLAEGVAVVNATVLKIKTQALSLPSDVAEAQGNESRLTGEEAEDL
jgi:hypothetical protein